MQLQVWDSPGLQDGTKNEAGLIYVCEISTMYSAFDLIVYTMRMTQTKILKANCRAMQILSQPDALGPNMWHNVIIVLTFANIAEAMIAECKVADPTLIDVKIQKIFRDDVESSISAIRTVLIESSVGLSQNLAESIPIVLAGYTTDPATLPKYMQWWYLRWKENHWLSDLWIKALEVTKL